jgi:hypothetical protein
MIGETTPSDGDSGIGIKRENSKGLQSLMEKGLEKYGFFSNFAGRKKNDTIDID